MKQLYVYAKPNQMVGHKFSDDCAIVYAENKDEAMELFRKLYSNIQYKDINEVFFNDYDVAILTSY